MVYIYNNKLSNLQQMVVTHNSLWIVVSDLHPFPTIVQERPVHMLVGDGKNVP